jgi:hypothetical protein
MVLLAGSLAQAVEYDIMHDLGDGMVFLAHAIDEERSCKDWDGAKVDYGVLIQGVQIRDVQTSEVYPLFTGMMYDDIEAKHLSSLCNRLGFDSSAVGHLGAKQADVDHEGYAWNGSTGSKVVAGDLPYFDSGRNIVISDLLCFQSCKP